MKLITSGLKINRTLGATVATAAIFCALLALGKAPSTKNTQTATAKQTAPRTMAITTTTVDQLRAYKSVLVWSDNGFADSTALGNNLADYVDGGGGVVMAVFALNSGYLNGRFVTGD